MFETLLSKTLFILSVSLGFCFLGAVGVVKFFRHAYEKGKSYVKATTNEVGQIDLTVDQQLLMKIFWPAFIINIITFFVLLFCRNIIPLNFFLMSLFTFTDGITIGIVLISIDENIGIKVTAITAISTLLASLIGMYSGFDFSFLGRFLFFALLGLILISIARLFKVFTEE